MTLTDECTMASTVEEKRNLVKRYLRENQYRYVDDIVSWLESIDNGFRRGWYTATATITKDDVNSDPCVSPLNALMDLIQKYKEEGFSEIPIISWEGIHLTGTFLETEEQFLRKIGEYISAWLKTHEKDEGKIREEIAQHEREIRKLRAQLTDIRD